MHCRGMKVDPNAASTFTMRWIYLDLGKYVAVRTTTGLPETSYIDVIMSVFDDSCICSRDLEV